MKRKSIGDKFTCHWCFKKCIVDKDTVCEPYDTDDIGERIISVVLSFGVDLIKDIFPNYYCSYECYERRMYDRRYD